MSPARGPGRAEAQGRWPAPRPGGCSLGPAPTVRTGDDHIRVDSDIVDPAPFDLLLDAIDRAGELLATRLRGAPQLGGDLVPLAALGAQVDQRPLLFRQPAAK